MRIPGTTFHDSDPPKPDIELLQKRIKFYESVMKGLPPHQVGQKRCKIAEAAGKGCCNPACDGNWGTGCWCCHYLEFAIDAQPSDMDAHLALKP